MRRLICSAILAVTLASSTGCFVPIFSANKERRAAQLMVVSENLRAVLDEWERFWFLDQPDHMTPYRTHGGII